MDEEGSRLPLLIVIALLVLAAFGGVVWLAYSEGLQKGRESAPQVIAADRGPVRTAPENPGGATPYQGLKIYEQPAPSESESAPATGTPPAAAPSTHAQTTAPTHAPSAPPHAAAVTAPKPAAPKPAAPKPATTKPASAPVKTASTAGGYVLQIGAYKSEAEAKTAWKSYQRKHPLVGGYTPNIKRVDLGAKGVWYRLRIGSFASRGAAGTLCAKLKADGGGCFPARN